MLSFNVQFTGIEKAVSHLQNYKEIIKNLKPEFDDVGGYLTDYFERDVWESEGSALGAHWADLSEPYRTQKASQYPGRGILERTGTLRYGFRTLSSSERLIIWNDTPYGVYLEFGTENMPPRIFFKLTEEMQMVMRNMIIEGIESRARAL